MLVSCSSFTKSIAPAKVTEGIPLPFTEWTLHYYTTTTTSNATTNRKADVLVCALFFLVQPGGHRWGGSSSKPSVRWWRIISVTRTTGQCCNKSCFIHEMWSMRVICLWRRFGLKATTATWNYFFGRHTHKRESWYLIAYIIYTSASIAKCN